MTSYDFPTFNPPSLPQKHMQGAHATCAWRFFNHIARKLATRHGPQRKIPASMTLNDGSPRTFFCCLSEVDDASKFLLSWPNSS